MRKIDQARGSMGSSPLYLHQGSVTRLDIDMAHRLRIERKVYPVQHIPLHLVSRVVCSTQVDISARALVACLRKGVPVMLVEPGGAPAGWCFGVRRTENTLAHLLQHALDDVNWKDTYRDWIAQHQLAISAQVLLLCEVPNTAAARANPRIALCNAHRTKRRQASGEAVDALARLAQHEFAAQLARETGDPTLLSWTQPGFNLIADLGQLLGLHAHIDVHHAPLPNANEPLELWALRRYERRNAEWQQRMAHLQHAFTQFLRVHWQ